ncbi:MAG: GNAT family N-acetyltransferase [Anaerolineae bacterium]|nr:GNAT family N-acetyltransferase [Anaerolineae bacterium]
MSIELPSSTLNRTLASGLQLRQATLQDRQAVVEFVSHWLHEALGINVFDLMSGNHPTTQASDFAIITDPAAGDQIVATAGLIGHTWSYEELPFGVGTPEFVATHKDYRRRGLMSAVMEALHQISKNNGQLVQAVNGIPNFYRQFDYEYALDGDNQRAFRLGNGALVIPDTSAYLVRRAQVEDIPALLSIYVRQRKGRLITNVMDEKRWRFDLTGHSAGSDIKMRHYSVLSGDGQIVGYFKLWGDEDDPHGNVIINEFGVIDEDRLVPIMQAVVKALAETTLQAALPDALARITLALGRAHRAYNVMQRQLVPIGRPTSWYLRVPDLVAFVTHILPVLNRRLARSMYSSVSRAVVISLYKEALTLKIEAGQVVNAANMPMGDVDEDTISAWFPPLVFLKLLFGYRALDELLYAYPDVQVNEADADLVNVLFPKQESWMIYLG